MLPSFQQFSQQLSQQVFEMQKKGVCEEITVDGVAFQQGEKMEQHFLSENQEARERKNLQVYCMLDEDGGVEDSTRLYREEKDDRKIMREVSERMRELQNNIWRRFRLSLREGESFVERDEVQMERYEYERSNSIKSVRIIEENVCKKVAMLPDHHFSRRGRYLTNRLQQIQKQEMAIHHQNGKQSYGIELNISPIKSMKEFKSQSKHIDFDLQTTRKAVSERYSLKTVKTINKAMSKYNLMTLKTYESSEQFHTFFRDLIKNWNIYHASYQPAIQTFVRINEYKQMIYRQAYDLLYPKMGKLLKQLRWKLKICSLSQEIKNEVKKMESQNYQNMHEIDLKDYYLDKIRKNLCIEDHVTDRILMHFFQDQNSIKKQQGVTYIKIQGQQRVQLKQFISDYEQFRNYPALWQNLFNNYRLKVQIQSNQTNDSQKIRRKMMQNFTKNAHFERMVECGCLGCSSFFTYGGNVLDYTINTTPIISLPEISKMKDYESRIKDEICALLNSGGGVILFGTKEEYKNVITYGESITEKDKEEYEQRIYSYLEGFHPRPETKRNVFVSFVPVVVDPYAKDHLGKLLGYAGAEGMAKRHQAYYQREYIEGLYVARIRVCPTDGMHVYSWSSEQGQFFSSIRKKGKTVPLKMWEIPSLMKSKFNRFFVREDVTPQTAAMLQKPVNCFNHECAIAQIGIPINTRFDGAVRGARVLQNEYNFMTMIIAKKSDLDDIKRKFRAKNVDCDIEYRFHSYKFKPAHNTAILYHSIRFEELLRVISTNQEFQYNGRTLMAINITGYIRLQARNIRNKLTQGDFCNLKAWLAVEFPSEELRLWEWQVGLGQCEYYLQTETKLSTQFMYFVLNHYSEKATFKNPQGFERMTQEERSSRWRQVFFQGYEGESKPVRVKGEDINKTMQQQPYKNAQSFKFVAEQQQHSIDYKTWFESQNQNPFSSNPKHKHPDDDELFFAQSCITDLAIPLTFSQAELSIIHEREQIDNDNPPLEGSPIDVSMIELFENSALIHYEEMSSVENSTLISFASGCVSQSQLFSFKDLIQEIEDREASPRKVSEQSNIIGGNIKTGSRETQEAGSQQKQSRAYKIISTQGYKLQIQVALAIAELQSISVQKLKRYILEVNQSCKREGRGCTWQDRHDKDDGVGMVSL